MNNTGIETSLREIASLARKACEYKSIKEKATEIAANQPTTWRKVEAIVEWVHEQGVGRRDPARSELLSLEPPYDADEAVLVAASMCVALDIPCHVVGVRIGEHAWTCWLSFMEGYRWRTVDVMEKRFISNESEAVERIEVRVQESNPETEHEERQLPSGVVIEVGNETRYNVERYVRLKAPCPEHPQNAPIEVTVGGSVSSYKSEPMPPTLLVSSHSSWSRKQWELVKRLADQAWDEYERRFLVGKGQ